MIDVLQRFRKRVPPGKQSYEADYEAIAELQKIASDTGVAIVVVHHTRKGEADDPIDAVSGTLGLAGAADAVLIIARTPQGVRLYGRSRDVDEIDKAIEFNTATCRWTILGETADVRRSAERQANPRRTGRADAAQGHRRGRRQAGQRGVQAARQDGHSWRGAKTDAASTRARDETPDGNDGKVEME